MAMTQKSRSRLTIQDILAWADAHHAIRGRWPICNGGPVEEGVTDENWITIDAALRSGSRGLPGNSSLSCLLQERRGVVPHAQYLLTVPLILAWADAYHERTGKWPITTSGPVVGASGGTWCAIDRALRRGSCGLPGGSSLPALLFEHRGHKGGLRKRASGSARASHKIVKRKKL